MIVLSRPAPERIRLPPGPPCAFLLGGSGCRLRRHRPQVSARPEIPVGVITAVIGGPAFLYPLGKRCVLSPSQV
jgi:hypothetical protein